MTNLSGSPEITSQLLSKVHEMNDIISKQTIEIKSLQKASREASREHRRTHQRSVNQKAEIKRLLKRITHLNGVVASIREEQKENLLQVPVQENYIHPGWFASASEAADPEMRAKEDYVNQECENIAKYLELLRKFNIPVTANIEI